MLERLSERVGPTGSLQGEGIANLLGRPPFDPITLVLRESAQNIWDARKRSGASNRDVPKMLVRVRTLDKRQAALLQRLIESSADEDDEPQESNALLACLAGPGLPRVLEICDFGTIGLDGQTDPQSSVSRFVKFFFDFGSAHFDSGDGGTYGYGRSSLYLAGSSRTILVDTMTGGSSSERRFMGARIGNAYTREINGRQVRFTGRHFWGKVGEERRVDPVRGRAAMTLARALGMPERTDGDTGTTIMIPWPNLPDVNAGPRVADILLHNLWPKLVSKTGAKAMKIEVEEDTRSIPVTDPCRHSIYSLFASALIASRTRDPAHGAVPTFVRRTKMTGNLAFAETPKRPVQGIVRDPVEFPETIFDGAVRHVALMRPSELVVRYLEFPGVGDDVEWAGVFLCSEAEPILRAFASAEPPAHDDWVPDRLSGEDATLVRVTKLKRIPEEVRKRFGITTISGNTVGANKASLAAAADRFSERFIAGDGSAPGQSGRGGSGGTGGGGGGSPGFRTLTFARLRADDGKRIAQFLTALCGGASTVVIRGVVEVEGAGSESLPAGMRLPHVIGWMTPAGERVEGARCHLDQPGDYLMEVEFGGDYAINARCERVED